MGEVVWSILAALGSLGLLLLIMWIILKFFDSGGDDDNSCYV